jgi:hypothetical protein
MSTLSYANEKLGLGIDTLATHPGPIKERLIAAFHGSLAQVPTKDLPHEAGRLWAEIWATVTAYEGTTTSGRFEPSINALDPDEAVLIAKAILNVWVQVKAALRGTLDE